MSGPDSAGQVIATGSQDLAALAGLFCTDAVESNALAFEKGYDSCIVSTLSLLGILGLVKSSIKLVLGLERCKMAGFALESVRGIFGYTASEASKSLLDLKQCFETCADFSHEEDVYVTKTTKLLDVEQTPVLNRAIGWFSHARLTTTVNLGNRDKAATPYRNLFFFFIFAFICAGMTAWCLLFVSTKLSWVSAIAMPVLHICLLLIIVTPIGIDEISWASERYLSVPQWEALFSQGNAIPKMTINLLQVNLDKERGDILHPRGSPTVMNQWAFRVGTAVVCALTVAGYVCQYAIVKQASNRKAVLWIVLQAVMAAIRLLYWTYSPSIGHSGARRGEFVMVNNSAFRMMTVQELVCACLPGHTKIPRWAWDYLVSTSLHKILSCATLDNTSIPENAVVCSLLNLDLDRVLRNRIGTYSKSHDWRLALWKKEDGHIQPFILVSVGHVSRYVNQPMLRKSCVGWIRGISFVNDQPISIHKMRDRQSTTAFPCTLFAVDGRAERVHLNQIDDSGCSLACPFSSRDTLATLSNDSHLYLSDRSRIVATLRLLADQIDDVQMVNTWGYSLWLGASDPAAETRLKGAGKVTGRIEIAKGLELVRDEFLS